MSTVTDRSNTKPQYNNHMGGPSEMVIGDIIISDESKLEIRATLAIYENDNGEKTYVFLTFDRNLDEWDAYIIEEADDSHMIVRHN